MKNAVTLALLTLAACGGKSMDPPGSPASSTAGQTRPLPGDPACELPAGVSTTETNDGCYAMVLSVTAIGTPGTPGSLCSASEFGLVCESPDGNATGFPAPPPSLGCAPAMGVPLPPDVSEYCCPCAPGSTVVGGAGGSGGSGGAPADAGSSGSDVTCTAGSGSGSQGGSYTLQASKTSAGTTYQVSCTCPAATCTCAEASGQSGGGGGGVAFSACAETCSSASASAVSAAYEACGFPH
jgi:hypothetical protein